MVETTTVGNGKLSVSACCPVCNEKVRLSFVPSTEKRSGSHSTSNLYRHVLRHTTTSSTRVTGSSKSNKRKFPLNVSRKSKRSRNEDSDSGSDDDRVEKELIENYCNESDDLVDDDLELEETGSDIAKHDSKKKTSNKSRKRERLRN